MGTGKYTPRLSVELSPELYKRLQDCIPWGNIKPVMTTILEQLLDILEALDKRDAMLIIGAIISKRVSLLDVLKRGDDV